MKQEATRPEFTALPNLALDRLGALALATSDDFFAEKENLLKGHDAVWDPDRYTDRGKWMDGWESRRKRVPGHDWCIVRLGVAGVISGVDIDTAHFLGNHPGHASLDALAWHGPGPLRVERLDEVSDAWETLLDRVPLERGSHNDFPVTDTRRFTHVRLRIHPDGGVARLRVFGRGQLDASQLPAGSVVDTAGLDNGGVVLAANDYFFSSPNHLLIPGRASGMHDGWETRRRRANPPNADDSSFLEEHDWCVVALGAVTKVAQIAVETHHFKGNFADRCTVEGVHAPGLSAEGIASADWKTLVPVSPLSAHWRHLFAVEADAPITHVRLRIFPDGGVSRLRVYGWPQ